ncbi:MAG TPA: flagellar hook-basal body protein [Bacillota bacterium]|jgi:flagellar basal-body rod protein FlgG|nr:flagellar hook-basal body protein [Bacillota bacterium]HQC82204.1 flagellar hook-basal body protein [Bacillota bacterium]
MIRGFYTAATSLVAQQTHLNVIANNVANVSTTGFKPQQVGFASLLHSNINGGAANTIQMGHGVRVQKTGINFVQGDLKQTDMPLDFAIMGEGFFAVENAVDGTIAYTRDGSFQASIDGRRTYLIDAQGNYVLDSRERRIELDDDFDHKQIGVFRFANPYGLELVGGNRFVPTEASGDPEDVDEPDIKVGYLENSSVQLSQEIVKMIEASKGFSLGSKVLQAADEMERTINQLR